MKGNTKLPKSFPATGLVVDVPELRSRIGAWIMPDNSSPGALENFLREMVKKGDRLISHAEAATIKATKLGATFSKEVKPKAIIHAWLAWQEMPGCPFGIALKRHYFGHEAPAARKFVEWVRKLVN